MLASYWTSWKVFPNSSWAHRVRLPASRHGGGSVILITRSVGVLTGRYIVADAVENGVLQIGADNVIVDFGGAALLSCADPANAAREISPASASA